MSILTWVRYNFYCTRNQRSWALAKNARITRKNLFNFFASLKKLLSLSIIKVNFFSTSFNRNFSTDNTDFLSFFHLRFKTAGLDITIFHQDFVCTRHKPNKFGFCSRWSQNSLFDCVKIALQITRMSSGIFISNWRYITFRGACFLFLWSIKDYRTR